MKKILTSIVLVAYFTVSSGFVISMHYCMDRLDSFEIGNSSNDKCSKCGMHKNGGCCKDEVMMVKLETSHIASQVITSNFSLPLVQLINTEFLLTPFRNYIQQTTSIAHSPPLIEQDVCIKNCVFRI
jgi:hypothetical protein